MKQRINISVVFLITLLFSGIARSQAPEELVRQVRDKLDKVNDYEAQGKMKTNVVFLKAPIASIKIYFKKPNKLHIKNESGISFIPKGSVNINLSNIFLHDNDGFDIIDLGKEAGTNLRIIKLLPKNDTADIVLSTL